MAAKNASATSASNARVGRELDEQRPELLTEPGGLRQEAVEHVFRVHQPPCVTSFIFTANRKSSGTDAAHLA
jgi:hypothetical protein